MARKGVNLLVLVSLLLVLPIHLESDGEKRVNKPRGLEQLLLLLLLIEDREREPPVAILSARQSSDTVICYGLPVPLLSPSVHRLIETDRPTS